MDVFVLTRGFLLDHSLVGVFSSLEKAKRASGSIGGWVQITPGMWARCLSDGSTSPNANQGWAVEHTLIDEFAA